MFSLLHVACLGPAPCATSLPQDTLYEEPGDRNIIILELVIAILF